MSKTSKTSIKIAAIALAIGAAGAAVPASAGVQTAKRSSTHSRASSASVSVPALAVIGAALRAISRHQDSPNFAWATQASEALEPQNGYPPDLPVFASDTSRIDEWAAGKAQTVIFTNAWFGRIARRLVGRAYSSPKAAIASAAKLIEGTDPSDLQELNVRAAAEVAQSTPRFDFTGADVHYFIGDSAYRANAKGWSIERNGQVWFGGASGGQERINGRIYGIDIRNGDEFRSGTEQAAKVGDGR